MAGLLLGSTALPVAAEPWVIDFDNSAGGDQFASNTIFSNVGGYDFQRYDSAHGGIPGSIASTTISVSGGAGFAVGFDSSLTNTRDPDLEQDFNNSGNSAIAVNGYRNILIIQSNENELTRTCDGNVSSGVCMGNDESSDHSSSDSSSGDSSGDDHSSSGGSSGDDHSSSGGSSGSDHSSSGGSSGDDHSSSDGSSGSDHSSSGGSSGDDHSSSGGSSGSDHSSSGGSSGDDDHSSSGGSSGSDHSSSGGSSGDDHSSSGGSSGSDHSSSGDSSGDDHSSSDSSSDHSSSEENPADDEAGGGDIVFDFDQAVRLLSMNIFDIEEEGGKVKFFDGDDNLLSMINLPTMPNNGVGLVNFGDDGIVADKMVVWLAGSGAIDNIRGDVPQQAIPEPGTLGILGLGLFGLGYLRRRKRMARAARHL